MLCKSFFLKGFHKFHLIAKSILGPAMVQSQPAHWIFEPIPNNSMMHTFGAPSECVSLIFVEKTPLREEKIYPEPPE